MEIGKKTKRRTKQKDIRTDFHLHCRFSADSKGDPNEMVLKAIERGASIICFTDHVDFDFPEQIITFDPAEYTVFMRELRERYRDRIDIRMGVEVGLQPSVAAENKAFVESAPFDFVIGSTHLVNGLRPNTRRFAEYKERYPGKKEGTRAYLEATLENVRSFDDYDVYGHIDYITCYSYRELFSYAENRDIMDEILKLLLERGKGLELNTSEVPILGESNPCHDVLRRYRELGGEIVTLGSDAHSPEGVVAYMDWAVETLKSCGFRYFTVFKDRKPEFIAL